MRACVNVDIDGIALFTPINEERLMSDWTHVDELLLEETEDWTELLPRVLEKKIDFHNGPLWYVKWIRLENNNSAKNNGNCKCGKLYAMNICG